MIRSRTLTIITITSVITILASIASCRRHHPTNQDPGLSIERISDSLRAGNTDFAFREIEFLKKQAIENGDSDLWSSMMVQQSVGAYYAAQPELLLSSADSAIAWLSSQKPTESRLLNLHKAYQCHGAYFDQYFYNADSALFYLRKGLDYAEQLKNKDNLPLAYGNYANSLRMAGDLDSAAYYYHRAILLADSLGFSKDSYISLYNGLAGVHCDLRDFKSSDRWWKKSMSMISDMMPYDHFNTMSGYGNNLYYHRDYKESAEVFEALRAYLDSVPGSEWEQNFTSVNLADTYLRIGRLAPAREMLDSAVIYFSEVQPNPVCMSYIHSLQIRLELLSGDNAAAGRLIEKHPISDTIRTEQYISRLEVLADYYQHTAQWQKAYRSLKELQTLNDSIKSEHLRQQLSALSAVYERDNAILTLKAENSRQQARIFRLLVYVTGSVALLLIILGILFNYRARNRRHEEKMMNKIRDLRQENLHQRITPHFIYNALNHELHAPGQLTEQRIGTIVRLLRHQQRAAGELETSLAEELDFVSDYISVASENITDFRYIKEIGSDIDTANIRVPSMSLQILVENAFKHGFARMPESMEKFLAIKISRLSRVISIEVFNNTDPSTAPEPPSQRSGLGLRIIMESAKIINDKGRGKITFSVTPDSYEYGMNGYKSTITISSSAKMTGSKSHL